MTEDTVAEQPVRAERLAGPGPSRTPLVAAIVLGAVCLVLLGALIVVASWWVPLQNEAREREEVRQVARELALRLTTFEGERIEAWVAETKAMATGDYARQVDRLFDQEFRDALRDAQAVSRGELIDLFVQDIDEDRATAFAVVRQTIANIHLDDPVEDELRMEITLERVEDEWKVADVAVLPSAGVPRDTPLPGAGSQEEP